MSVWTAHAQSCSPARVAINLATLQILQEQMILCFQWPHVQGPVKWLSHKSHLRGSVSSMSSTLHQIPVIQCRVHWSYWKSSRETFGWVEKSPTGAASSPLEYMSSREMKPGSFNIFLSGNQNSCSVESIGVHCS